MTYDELLRASAGRLLEAGVEEDPARQAAVLLQAAGGPDRGELPLLRRREVPETLLADFLPLLERRVRREPLQQILGQTWFYGLPFAVSPAVLCPRSDTETLVELALKTDTDGARALDLCTGSGCVGIALAAHGGFSELILSDISEEALKVAARNAAGNAAAFGKTRVRLARGDFFAMEPADGAGPLDTEPWDLIVCNPPYIPRREIASLMPEVRDHEPASALDGGTDGLDFYRRLAAEAPAHLRPEGKMLLEIGCEQAGAVREILTAAGWRDIRVHRDLAGLDRVAAAARPAVKE